MPLATLTFYDPLNSSLQIGDIVYYSNSTSPAPNSNIKKTTTSNVFKLGVVYSITSNPTAINVIYETGTGLPQATAYIMFEKDKQVNSSSLLGYYANVKLVNDSKGKIELFSLGSEVSESSK
jgi:hypothetical protein